MDIGVTSAQILTSQMCGLPYTSRKGMLRVKECCPPPPQPSFPCASLPRATSLCSWDLPRQHIKLHTYRHSMSFHSLTGSPHVTDIHRDSLLSTLKHGSSNNCVLTWSRLRYPHSRFLGRRMLSHGRHTTVGDLPSVCPQPGPA